MNFIRLDVFKHATFSFCDNILVSYNIILNDKKIKKINQQISTAVRAIWSASIRKYNSTRQSKSKQPNKLTRQQTGSTLVPDEH